MEKRIKIRRDLKDFQLKKPVLFGAVFVFLFTSILSYAFFFCVREICGLYTIYGNYNSVIYEINPWWYAFFNFIFAGFAVINGINSTLNFITKANDRGHSIRERKALRHTATNSTILFPSFLHTALEVVFCISIISGWDLLFNYGLEPITLSILGLTLVVFYFSTWNLVLKYYPQFLSKVVKGFLLFLLSAFILSLWLPINMPEIKKEIVATYPQYQMSIELPRTNVMKWTRRSMRSSIIFIGKSGEYQEEIYIPDTMDIFLRPYFSHLSIVADGKVKMKKIASIKKTFLDERVRRYYFATEKPAFASEKEVYRKYFGRGRMFVFGLKNPMPPHINYPTKENLETFLKENADYDFAKYLANETFIKLYRDSFIIDNEKFMKEKFAEKIKMKLNPEQGFCILIDGELNIQEFIRDMDEFSSVDERKLFLTFNLQEYEFLKMQKSL